MLFPPQTCSSLQGGSDLAAAGPFIDLIIQYWNVVLVKVKNLKEKWVSMTLLDEVQYYNFYCF